MKLLFAALLLVSVPTPGQAQQDSSLIAAVRLVTEGQGDSARALVRARLASTRSTDSAYPEILYTAGVVAAAFDSATFYLRRVSIEYPQSAWADRALLRLAQQAFGTGDFLSARRAAERILADYPFGPAVPEAAFWAGRSHLEQGSVEDGCRLLTQAADAATEDVELANRIRYYRQRCDNVTMPPRDTTATPRSIATPTYAVQIAAVQNVRAADEVMRRVAAAGFDPYVVRDTDGLFKVRVGRFTERAPAQALVAQVRTSLGGSPFVVEER